MSRPRRPLRSILPRRRLAAPLISASLLPGVLLLAPLAARDPPATTRDHSPPRTVTDLAQLLEPIRRRHTLPALAAAVVDGDQLRASGATGTRARGSDAPVTTGDLFHLGSCTKAMTATLCALLVEDGTLRWGLTLAEAFPDLREQIHPDYRAVTLEQLLTNLGGVPADLRAGGLWAKLWSHPGTPTEARRVLLEGVVRRPPSAPPGTHYIYSNAGFAIAGHIAETITGTAFEELMQQRLFKPLEMTSAGFGAPGSADVVDQPRGHRPDGEAVAPSDAADNPAAIAPAGRVHCTLADWGRFISLHLRGAAGDTDLLMAETFEKLHEPRGSTSYAMGWIVTERDWAGGHALTHAGSNTMWYAVVWAAPERGFAVLVACNQGDDVAAKACDEAAAAVIRQWQEKEE